MKELILAESAGFCFGVKRAVDTVYDKIREHGGTPIYTYGPIIHNEVVVKDLEEHGVTVVNSVEELSEKPAGIMIIRSHGISKAEYDAIENHGFEIVDATCPFVRKIHNAVHKYSGEGHHIVIVGNTNHPEVEGIKGWCDPAHTTVVETKEEARAFSLDEKMPVLIVSQTTFPNIKFQELVEIIQEKGYDIIVLNTICNATEERQTEARKIAKNVDAMIVIGGKNSSNSQKLYEICKDECPQTYFIQTLNDLDVPSLQAYNKVGITAGASTPQNIIEEVQNNVRNEF